MSIETSQTEVWILRLSKDLHFFAYAYKKEKLVNKKGRIKFRGSGVGYHSDPILEMSALLVSLGYLALKV